MAVLDRTVAALVAMDRQSFERCLAIATGIATYYFYFRRGEKHAFPWRFVLFYLVSAVALVFLKSLQPQHLSAYRAAVEVITLGCLHIVALYAGLIIWRVLLNPLNKFPGPPLARVTKLYMVYRNYQSNLHSHHELLALHKKYGPYVRIGPNDLSVADPLAMPIVLGPNSKCRKSAWYGQDAPAISINTTRDRAAHDRRRRILAPAFNDKSLRGYAGRIQKYHDLLIRRIEEHVSRGEAMNVTKWFGLHGFDMMGDLVFSRSFRLLETGEASDAIKLLPEGLYPQGFAFPPWLYRVYANMPGVGAGYHRFVALAEEHLQSRLRDQGKTEQPDMLQPLLKHHQQLAPGQQQQEHMSLLQGDSRMLIVAGSDTTSTTLIHIFYRFCTETGLLNRLREEIEPLVAGNIHAIAYQDIHSAELLHGCINETLRLHYPGPSGFFRKTPPGGIHIGDVYVPADTIIQIPPYVMAYNEEVYERCTEFVPERWNSRPEMIRHKDAFMPFLQGSESCIGKQLAFIQLSIVVAQIILQFDVKFADGEDGARLIQDSLDLAMLHPAQLDLTFTRRKSLV